MPTHQGRAGARTQRFDRSDVDGDDPVDGRRSETLRGEPTGRIGTFAASSPEPPGPAFEEAAPPATASRHLAVHVAATEARPAVPGRARRVHRAIEDAGSDVRTDVDLEAVPARVGAPTERLERAAPRAPRRGLWLLGGAIVLSVLVLAAAFAVRDATHEEVIGGP